MEQIRIGHSPDSDDAFMFYALAKKLIPTDGFEVVHVIEDIESLNKRALNSELEVTAISIHAYAYVSQDYALMPCGASIGDRYGPIVVSTSPIDLHNLSGKRIAIPGTMTTAYLTLRLFEPDFIPEVVPFDQILDHVKQGKSDAGLIIHEGQLTYQSQGFHKVIDLGEWWYQETDLPLPLGANVIRRDLGPEKIKKITSLLRQSIQYSLSHRQEGLEYAMVYARDMESDSTLADRFVSMYVNDYTLDYGQKGRAGVHELLNRGYQSGVITSLADIDFVEL
ncbi:TPA: ABC transporter substrate-binding protein [Candidatus Poribacteria bacterium]|jgi:1,4-dihydroxy-6-naphthoate synthase|nr:ABC transporter substrate-binding protein [Candidatus Poribacteria bacterium]HIB86195.1 ABC transporter substrate-binding protein [Candidatus Poribacteria bacterium]HIC00970.1 ABC transporter substrate-binding protein [Candidatus Poribacteria bacterium]HIN28018.1 ABC transporter substrate-binding protein [Candidatus Poribacteria bacterium]HIO05361.1 ABC transporter substrate-binding protein [Candidatus Poribacteria bacterium]